MRKKTFWRQTISVTRQGTEKLFTARRFTKARLVFIATINTNTTRGKFILPHLLFIALMPRSGFYFLQLFFTLSSHLL